jgi:hypothetical protein
MAGYVINCSYNAELTGLGHESRKTKLHENLAPVERQVGLYLQLDIAALISSSFGPDKLMGSEAQTGTG